MKYLLLIIATLCFSSSVLATNVKYSFELRTQKSYCYALINGVKISDSNTIGGTISSGYDISTILQNGKNTMTIIFTGVDDSDRKKIEQDSYCTLLIKEKRKDDMVNYVSLVGDSLNSLASGKNSPHYDGLGQAGKVTEGYWEKVDFAYKVARTFTISGAREWTWTKGEKIVDSKKNRESLYVKYMDLFKALNKKDKQVLLNLFYVGLSEKADVDNSTIEEEWKSLGIYQMLDDGYKPKLEDISNYKIVTYADGKLFRLEDKNRYSPLIIEKDRSEDVLNPYFAYVDGEIIVAL
ncbi:hypothetical protein [Photobacterium damselae]|uniref:hypothetical protein n=1 Tax=Photobacterium damselae TaxID=38293 RepID=UPI001EFE3351|nr:hypothetical protein [Photobacterium damselae]MCG9777141.1 hypothetical protein [Photobacterium damselae]